MECSETVEFAQMADLFDIEIGRRERRAMCQKCCRPAAVCWCKSLRGAKVNIESRVVLLQHPSEQKRSLRTAPILEALLPEGHYVNMKGKRFSFTRFPNLEAIIQDPHSLLLYPGKKACDLNTLPPVGSGQPPYNIIIIDGTWQQAKAIYNCNSYLKEMKQVRLSTDQPSHYIIRTQPTEDALSTVESAAVTLATLEKNWSIHSALIHPLKLICQFQMDHGAVEHHSKEFLIVSGQYDKQLGKRTCLKLKRSSDVNNHLSLKEILSARKRNDSKVLSVSDINTKNAILDDENGEDLVKIVDIEKCSLKEDGETFLNDACDNR